MSEVNFQSPLKWLPQQPRSKRPERARFSTKSISRAGGYLADELRKLGGKNCIISSNLQTKVSGGFYANQKVEDPGVVIYFDLKGTGKAMACDKWDKPEHNLWALYLSVAAIRGLERWGGSEFLDGLFTGFMALPAPGDIMVQERDYFIGIENQQDLKSKYKELAKELHPDLSGSSEEFNIMSKQFKQRDGNL